MAVYIFFYCEFLMSTHTSSINFYALVPCRYYLKESRGSRRWLIFLEGQFSQKNILISVQFLFYGNLAKIQLKNDEQM